MAVPKEVWAAAKALWESTPNITYQEVVDHLQEVYGDKAPASKSAVYNRAKKYDWQKLSMLELKERAENAEKKQNKSEQNGVEKKLENKENNKVKNEHETQIYRTIIDSTDRTKQKIVLSTEQRASVIIKHRNRLHNLGALEDAITMLSLDVAENVLNPTPIELDHVSTGDDDDYRFYDDEEDPIAKKLGVIKSLSFVLGNLTQAQKVIAEQEMPMCGISAEDFKQSEQERRLGALEALAGIDEEERVAREKLHRELQERMQSLTQLEHDPDFFGNGDAENIEDAEFDED
ncbi:hypothetical protein [Psychrobacter sanguinis]|uniref:hypothetical protein n=1 Tax=Psychrobacter sanguinis TaxID=861445 RepID=UPI001919A829|nr:hypothetical protein [Psychrobacter sanguinis]UEC24842.1 hypothetical protein LK453_09865 [Psychrobacter sanguinis]